MVLFLIEGAPILFAADLLGMFFAAVATLVFLLAGVFSLSYMKHEKNKKGFYGFYILTYCVVIGLCFAANMITLYALYEFMTLASMPLVLHTKTKEAIMAALKYMIFSFCGAYMALFGIWFLSRFGGVLPFAPGGTVDIDAVKESGKMGLLYASAFLMVTGFGVKAGMFPLHSWLASAHPVAPSPASAVLSGIIVKGGILAVIRTVYYCIGTDVLKGTWVQTAWATLSVVTIIMGSSLAFKEKILKKRLAYSTVSNLSYIMLGLSMMNAEAFTGSLLHVSFHALIKSALFMSAGALVFSTGKTGVDDFCGFARRMPVLFCCYTIVSLGLIGIPPTSGIWSKWHIALGCMESQMGVLSWLGAAALLVSALLTAGYLLPISIKGFSYAPIYASLAENCREPELLMLVPIIIMAVLTVIFGIYPQPLIEFIHGITAALM